MIAAWTLLALVLVAAMPTPALAQAKPLTDLTFSLDFVVLGRHAPWYVALGKGYYQEAGLNVKIIPGQGTAQAIQALESGVAEIVFSDVASLVLARARGTTTARMVAVNYQKAPYAIFSLNPGANVDDAPAAPGPRGGERSGKVLYGAVVLVERLMAPWISHAERA